MYHFVIQLMYNEINSLEVHLYCTDSHTKILLFDICDDIHFPKIKLMYAEILCF